MSTLTTGVRWDQGACDPIADIRQSLTRTILHEPETFWFGGSAHTRRALAVYGGVEATRLSVEEARRDADVTRLFAAVDRVFAQAFQTVTPHAFLAITISTEEDARGPVVGEVDGLVIVAGAPAVSSATALVASTWRARVRYKPAQRRREARRGGRGRRVPLYRPREEVKVYAAADVPAEVKRKAVLLVLTTVRDAATAGWSS